VSAETGSAEFFLLVGAGPRVVQTKFVSGEAFLKKADKALRSATLNVSFPGSAKTRLVRRGLVSCASMSGCSVFLYTPDLVRSLD
jgi:hypothetical protein